MTAASTPSGSATATGLPGRLSRVRRALPSVPLLAALLVGAMTACKDSNIPFFNAPTSIASSQDGIQNAVTGLFAASRVDIGTLIFYMTQFARDEGNIQFDNPQNIQFGTGITPIPANGAGVWDNEYLAIGHALSIIGAVPKAQPAYTPQQAAAIVGIAQTIEALNFMMLAETRDTLGIPIHAAAAGGPGPVYCNKDAWAQIVALLDSAEANLLTAGTIPLPVKLPPGFSGVSGSAGPPTTAGSFASFNRALAGKAGLELAYAIARNSAATAPTPSSPGAPDAAALQRADSAITASALFAPASLTPPVPGAQFANDASTVNWDFSSIAGDLVNPINQGIGVWVTLRTLAADVDTLNDARWKAKFGPTKFQLQIPSYAPISTADLFQYYPTTNSPIPIVRTEELALVRAQIRLGLGDLAGATTLINQVHQGAGGFGTPLNIAQTYTAVRDSLMKEQRISTVFEASSDRTIAIRMYGLQAVADTTWGSKDLHTTIVPVPSTEIEGRNNNYTRTCP